MKIHTQQLLYTLFFLLILLNLDASAQEGSGHVHVKDFGALVNDGRDDASAIRVAILHAQKTGNEVVRFEAGIYDFKDLGGWDKGEDRPQSWYLELEDLEGIRLIGEKDRRGNPLTLWLKNNDLKELQPGILNVSRGSDVVLRDIAIDMSPYYYSAGRVRKVEGDRVIVRVLEGHPFHDDQPAFIMGTYDLDERRAKVARITWDFDLPHWKRSGNHADSLLETSHELLASKVEPGEGVYWFQGNYTGALLRFSGIEDLLLDNVHIWNGHGFPLQCNFNKDVTYRKVKLIPPGNRIATACRDGFKIFSTGGEVIMDNIHIEGCLGDDGQNIHGLWLTPLEILGDKSMIVHYPIRDRQMPLLEPGGEIRLLNDEFQPGWTSVVKSSEDMEGSKQKLTFRDRLPGWIHNKTPVEAQQWLPDTMIIRNSVFRNTGRFGLLIKSSNTLIDRCIFEYNNAAIRMGGSWHELWLESMNSRNVEISNCLFRENKLDMLYGGRKLDNAIDIGATYIPGEGLMQDVRLYGNTFIGEGTCMDLRQVAGLDCRDNVYLDCGKICEIEEESCSDIRIEEQAIRIGEAELIYTEDEMPIRYDGSMSTIRKDDSTMYFFHSFGCRLKEDSGRRSRHSWHYGPPMDPLKVHHLSKTDKKFWDYNGYYQNMEEEGIWILGMYKAPDGTLIGITHSETRPPGGGPRDQVFSIGIGISTDKGASWNYCGEVVRAADPRCNVGGGAYIIKDGYLYVYYNDRDTISRIKQPCVARAKLKDVLKDASQHRVGKWYKYREGNWDTPGLSDLSGTGVIPLAFGGEDVHSDAAWCTALGKYLLTVQTHAARMLLLFSSTDGVNWKKEAVVDYAEEGAMQPYSSFVDYDGPSADCSSVDGDFYLYYPRKRLDDHEYDYMYRRKITIVE